MPSSSLVQKLQNLKKELEESNTMKDSKIEKVNEKDQHMKDVVSSAKKGHKENKSEENTESRNKVSLSATFYVLLSSMQIPQA